MVRENDNFNDASAYSRRRDVARNSVSRKTANARTLSDSGYSAARPSIRSDNRPPTHKQVPSESNYIDYPARTPERSRTRSSSSSPSSSNSGTRASSSGSTRTKAAATNERRSVRNDAVRKSVSVSRKPSGKTAAMSQLDSSHTKKGKQKNTAKTSNALTDYNSNLGIGKESKGSGVARFFGAIGSGIGAFFRFIGSQFGRKGTWAVRIVLAVVVVGAVSYGVDYFSNKGKIYKRVSVGAVDVGGMTPSEASDAIAKYYEPILADAEVTIYASEEAKELVESGKDYSQLMIDELSIEDAQGITLQWQRTPLSLGAAVASEKLAEEAMSVGREQGGYFKRLLTAIIGTNLPAYCAFDNQKFEDLATDIDRTLGTPCVESEVFFEDGTAQAASGHDGNIIGREKFTELINQAFLSQNQDASSFIAWTEYAPMRITLQIAKDTADRINQSIASGARFTYNEKSWEASSEVLSTWIATDIVETSENTYDLSVKFKPGVSQSYVMKKSLDAVGREPLTISFEKQGDDITVIPSAAETMPAVVQAVRDANAAFFGEDGLGSSSGSLQEITVSETDVPSTMSFDDAMNIGLVGEVSTFTTTYTTGTEARNNRNFNIHRCADFINNTICKADGGTWNFNDTTGNCDENAGFKMAGAIIDGLYIDQSGGGICQVATTVFNAVYEGGFPVPLRLNHTLYIDSYPAGRDAAVSYGEMNLIWENDSTSDVLLTTSYTDSSITVTLYGVSRDYVIQTDTSEWQAGDPYPTRILVDTQLGKDVDYISSYGEDGGSIVVTRIIKDENGATVREDTFFSTYDAKSEVRIMGPSEEAEKLIDSGQAQYITDEQRQNL